uniref:Protein FAM32A n=1 Tax=Tetraselmis sp. GSL018 TaxID=582737 RepID=A0A061R2H3_9CHLO|mmetsp:Transcript_38138/g.90588  ORF Transcript_38138/g.90588 Transcript_38138/m.90588 type:complete len:114 (-) Transcript_38138:87-428(-)|eukprot:CAMPEP_0177606334 /NCGR_PEP_ID=MMETSP0419_2-20121207/17246_1 /TAXON_ID=582737 /ORGANISM="Tetraselmis sp., Strain GSL018" /LENGTH=113 /DNA_ID=CAMNT_0019100677 /DNA_START=17 /DNA_END=358 /DNA_ORIENTATION=+
MSFTGGKLKLKHDNDVSGGVKKKKKKKRDKSLMTPSEGRDQDGEGGETAPAESKQEIDVRTEAEKKHDEMLAKREEELIRKMAEKSHKDKIKEMNDYLSKLSEHYDIPRVGPG